MVDIIRLNGDLHAQTQHLLPWYVTGTLEDDETAQVEKHLSECAECREDVEAERALAREIRALPNDVDHGWAVLKARIDETETAPRKLSTFPISSRWRGDARLARSAAPGKVGDRVALEAESYKTFCLDERRSCLNRRNRSSYALLFHEGRPYCGCRIPNKGQ